jgi:hypothetical protein
LIDVDLNRLDFIHSYSRFELKDSLYLTGLRTIAENYKSNPSSTEAITRISKYHKSKSGLYKPLQSDEYKWANKTALDYAEKAVANFPTSYGAQQALPIIEDVKKKELMVTSEDVNEPGKPFAYACFV